MGTVSFTKLNLKKKNEIKTIKINEQEIEVKQYLPIQDKLNVIRDSIIHSQDDNGFFNAIKLELHCTLQIIYAYTNLKFTDKQLEKEDEIYDLMESNGIIDEIFATIPEDETNMIMDATEKLAAAIKTYDNSVLGILNAIKDNYTLSKSELQQISDVLKNSTAYETDDIKEILSNFVDQINTPITKDDNN